MRRLVIAGGAAALIAACSNSNNFGDGGADGGGRGIGSNPNVSQNCQTCLSQSSGNDCANKQKNCTNDAQCVTLNDCINKCANVNGGCINNCGDTVSADAITEWNAWCFCACADCSSQCSATFCTVGDGGSPEATPDTSTCTADGTQCSQTSCCTFCASDGFCGCEPPNDGCVSDQECCSGFCDGTGTCQ